MGGVAPIPLRFLLARLQWARSVRRPGALARTHLFPAVPVGAGICGGGAGRAPAPLSGGGRGDHPPCLGGWGPGPQRLAGRWGHVSTAVAALQQRPHRPHNHSRQRPHRPHNHSRAAECSLDPFSHPHIPTFFRTFFLSSSHVSVCQLQAPLSLVHTSVWVRQRKWRIQEVWNFSSNFNQQFISAIMSVSFMSSVSSIIHHSSFSTLSIHQEFISSLSIHHHSSSHHSSSFIIHEKFGLRLRVLIMKIADASMQFLATLEPSSRIALKFPLITVKLAVTVKSRSNRQQSKQ